jgi:Kef-type K+ transport system membrane component KefB
MTGAFHPLHMNFLLLMGIAIFGGTVGARLFKLIRFPQVVGYIVIGVLLGESGIRLFDGRTLDLMRPFNFFTLGIIGFMIGGELKLSVLRKYGRQFMIILLAEGLGAFVVVSLLTTLVGGLLTHAWRASLGMGLLLGSISSATAPAATVDVLWRRAPAAR